MNFHDYQTQRRSHWDKVARLPKKVRNWGRFYHERLEAIYRHLIGGHGWVVEIGCGRGDLLASVHPVVGIGVDFSLEMLRVAKRQHPNLQFVQADAHALPFKEDLQLDAVILSDLVNDLWDALAVFKSLKRIIHRRTRLYLNTYSRLWEPILGITCRLGLSKPNLPQNWITIEDLSNILNLAGFETIRSWQEVLLPLPIPIINGFSNRVLVKIWPIRHLALSNFIAARKIPITRSNQSVTVSVIIPARNEAGNIPAIFERIPIFGSSLELIFIEGHSNDATYSTIENEIRNHLAASCKLLKQTGEGKGNAVREGFALASGKILMILDADLSVPPENLEYFYEALISGKVEFANGVRLIYPMEAEAMQFLNLVGNKFFSILFSWLLGQPIKDTLCGTKALWKNDYEKIVASRAYFGDFDPFGDFDLLLGAAKQNMKIVDIPVRYQSRTYGTTNIQRWSHGFLLLKMAAFAAVRLKFV